MESVAQTPHRREARIDKARRFVAEGRVSEIKPGVFAVEGDTATHHVSLNGSDAACSCRASVMSTIVCSHKLAVEVHRSAERLAVPRLGTVA